MVAPKREKMAYQRSMTQKKEREQGVTMSQKKRKLKKIKGKFPSDMQCPSRAICHIP